MANQFFIAADVGNARIKLGLFEASDAEPFRTLSLPGETPDFEPIDPWLTDFSQESIPWRIASVNRPAATLLIDWLRGHRPADRIALLACGDLPLVVRVPRPDMVGVDRLVDAVAVNRLRRPGRPAAIVDVGTAITVDLVSAEGEFLGGAILPGIDMSARALHHFTDLLPRVDVSELGAPPPPLGADTVSAIQAGLFWGALGAIRQLVEKQSEIVIIPSWGGSSTATPSRGQCEIAGGDRDSYPSWGGSSTATPSRADGRPQIFLTGGAGAAVADLIGPTACYVPNLTLIGIALAVKPSASGRP